MTLGHPFQADNTPEGHVDTTVFDFLIDAPLRVVHQRSEPHLPVVVSMSLSDEVEDSQTILPIIQPQPTAELLQKDSEALGGAEQQNGIYFRNVNPFVVQIDDENKVDFTVDEPSLHRLPLLVWRST